MKKRITFKITDKTQLRERISDFFKLSGFQPDPIESDKLTFIRRSSLLEAWKTNPLDWGSETVVFIADNQVTADFNIDTESQMNTAEEEKVWNNFIDNFKPFLENKNISGEVQTSMIRDVKKSRLTYFAWAVAGALTGGLVGILILNFSENKTLSFLCIPVFTTLFLKLRINFKKHNNAL